MGITRKRDALPPSIKKYIPLLQQELIGKADPNCREGWEKYLNQIIPFRGVKMADIRSVTHRWIRDNGIDNLANASRCDLVLGLIRQTCSEDKIAGILYLLGDADPERTDPLQVRSIPLCKAVRGRPHIRLEHL